MNPEQPGVEMTCDTAQDAMQARRDGALPSDDVERLDAHLLICDACREHGAALDAVSDVLRSLSTIPLPDDVLAEVLNETAAPVATTRSRVFRVFPWSIAGVAAALLFIVFAGPFASPPAMPLQASDAQVAEATSEAEYVLALTGRVLARVEQETFDQVIGEHVSPALKQIPFRLP